MSDRNMRWGQLTGVSKDKGPSKLIEVEHDGKKDDMEVIEAFGMQSSPHKDGKALIFLPDGDEGKAVCIVMPRPKDRQDKLKEGESKHMNHEKGQEVFHKANGDTHIKTPKGILHLNPA